MEIRIANIPSDLSDIVQLHIRAFPGFFMTDMGVPFLREYYQAVLEFSENISLIAVQDNKTIGFVVGFGNPQAFYNFYRQRYRRLITAILLAVLLNPRLISRVLSNFKRVSTFRGDASEVELSSIGVDPSLRGVGHLLIADFVNLAREFGYQSVYLTTDAEGNDRVNLFYKKQGFTLEQTFLSGQRKMNQYRLWL
jgi:ribosomal protein S18 acetylase RimI-like enzyme